MNGLYALKPWYARQLTPMVEHLQQRDVSPDVISSCGVLAGACGGAVLAFAPTGLIAAVLVAVCVAVRLACANMDGTVARARAPRAVGRLWNELGDRLADLALLAGLCSHVPWAGLVLLAATLPSWVSLGVSASGGSRANSGPMGKTERCVVAVMMAFTGWFLVGAVVLIVGSLLTVAVRLHSGVAELAEVQR